DGAPASLGAGHVVARAVGAYLVGWALLRAGGHRALAAAACRWHGFSRVLKGEPRPLVRDGAAVPGALRAQALGRHDLEEAYRLAGHAPADGDVREAWLERNGLISVVAAPHVPRTG